VNSVAALEKNTHYDYVLLLLLLIIASVFTTKPKRRRRGKKKSKIRYKRGIERERESE
jgi:uncharacterized membrane protein